MWIRSICHKLRLLHRCWNPGGNVRGPMVQARTMPPPSPQTVMGRLCSGLWLSVYLLKAISQVGRNGGHAVDTWGRVQSVNLGHETWGPPAPYSTPLAGLSGDVEPLFLLLLPHLSTALRSRILDASASAHIENTPRPVSVMGMAVFGRSCMALCLALACQARGRDCHAPRARSKAVPLVSTFLVQLLLSQAS